MKLVFSDQAWEDLSHWIDKDRRITKRIARLIEDTKRDPFSGIGKPEPLRHELSGYWSRRINEEHRLVYRVEDDELWIVALRYHYK
ncbi:Txe/YoeB family addiction module toxin [Akkermansiaceae bacterium]|nr:Txe/YoeB family addiction module toxin [Akkermansiaceae bacterium]MDB4456582.1 Txe/YoeB family addiction module toxin [bacterium]MDA8875969.1 Txe/YoeB family addiction module toxin [Akkermansiaceae bacterium]MDA8967145.1 Txe/YoeB family addiction module toxin [Akkermansiaceae bacterium]MDB4505106.1 Txe/YoeB family addiction module toxin [Akkermansiaceae bacterium]